MAQYAPADRPVVMDFVDMDSEKSAAYGAAAKPPMRWVWQGEARRLFHFERETARRAVVSLFVSEAEAALFARLTGADGVQAIANGIDTEAYDPAKPAARVAEAGELIVFTGQMDYPPNVEAVTWFANDILPLVRARRPMSQQSEES